MSILLKSAVIVDAKNPSLHLAQRDILIENGTITAIAPNIIAVEGTQEVRLDNLHVSIGWFDSGVAFGEPGREERETIINGLEVAATSGFTDIVLQPNTFPTPDTGASISFLKNRSTSSVTNLHPLGALTIKREGHALAELFDMYQEGAVGFYDFKAPIADANLMKIALQYAQNFNGLVCSFPMVDTLSRKGVANESPFTMALGLKGIPALAEQLQISRDLLLLEYTGGKLHIPTISTIGAVESIARAKNKGLDVSCSVAIHHLMLTDELLGDYNTNYKVIPPLRTSEEADFLKTAVRDGIIDDVTCDHIPIDIEEKRVEFDNAAYGTLGLESAFGALNVLFGMEKAIALLSNGRARFGIETPTIEKGAPANLSLFNPNNTYQFQKKHLRSTSKNSAFLEQTVKGIVYGVVNNGVLKLA
ncbi:MAG: dihydroorotase [Bacteroidota bacterium]